MVVSLSPTELSFRRPFTREVAQSLILRNSSKNPVAFKVKTTAPKQYCVRPNSGRIESQSEVEVQVLLQALREDPPLDTKCKDKFLVQTVEITPEREAGSVAAIWQKVESVAKDAVSEKKLRVVFLPAIDQASSSDLLRTPMTHLDEPHSELQASSPSNSVGVYASPAPKGSHEQEHSATTSSHKNERGLGDKDNGVVGTINSSNGEGVSTDKGAEINDQDAQISQANKKIANLTAQLEQQSAMRLRKPEKALSQEESVKTTTTQRHNEASVGGVSVQVVAILCLLSFLLAYFVF